MPFPQTPTPSASEQGAAAAWPRLRARFAAFGVVGALAVALPLVQVLRYQHAELTELTAQRAVLDPVGRTLNLQRGLIGHRDVAARVLHGDQALEPERLLRQADVDHRIAALAQTLETGPWEPARHEAASLRSDWAALLGRVVARSVDASGSNGAHRLLVEQALQIIDFVGDGVPAVVAAAGAATVPLQMPGWPLHARLAARLAHADGAGAEAELHVLQAAVVRASGALDRRIAQARAERTGVLVACSALAMGALACGLRLWHALRPRRGTARRTSPAVLDVESASSAMRATAHENDADDLIERLRRCAEQHTDPQPGKSVLPHG